MEYLVPVSLCDADSVVGLIVDEFLRGGGSESLILAASVAG